MNAFLQRTGVLEDYLDEFFKGAFTSTSNYPPSDVYIQDENLCFKFALAGFKKEDIMMDIDPETYYFTIATNDIKEEENKSDNIKWITNRIAKRSFKIKYQIPTCYNIDDIKADFDDGILSIIFNKNPEKQPKRITIG